MTTQHIGAVTVLLAAIVAPVANAVIINVPGDQPTIQAGIDVAVNGDDVVVAPGTYFETINFLGKAITLRSSDGPEVTIIDANFDGGSGVTCESGERADTVPCLESSRWSRANLAPSVIDCYGFGPIQ